MNNSDTHIPVSELSNSAKVRVIDCPVQYNAAAARNHGIEASFGEFIAVLDDDDMYLPNHLETQVAILKSEPNVDVVYCNFLEVSGERYYVVESQQFETELEYLRNPMIGHSSVVHRRCIDLYPVIKIRHDYARWIELMSNGHEFRYSPHIGYQRSLVRGSLTDTSWVVLLAAQFGAAVKHSSVLRGPLLIAFCIGLFRQAARRVRRWLV